MYTLYSVCVLFLSYFFLLRMSCSMQYRFLPAEQNVSAADAAHMTVFRCAADADCIFLNAVCVRNLLYALSAESRLSLNSLPVCSAALNASFFMQISSTRCI